MPTPTDARALQSVIGDLATLAIRDVVKLVGDYGSDPSFEWLLERVLPELLAPYIDGSAMVTAKHYTDMAPDLPYAGQEFPGISSERIAGTVKWALFGQRGSMLKRLAGAVQRIVFDASRNTVWENLLREFEELGYSDIPPLQSDAPEGSPPTDVPAEDDPLGTLYARYAAPDACGFCRILATKRAVYRSAESATRVAGRSVSLTKADYRAIEAGETTRAEALARRSVYRSQREAAKAGKQVGDRIVGALRGTRQYGQTYHDNCRCVAVAVRPGTDFSPPDYVYQWDEDYKTAWDGGARTIGELSNAMDKLPGGRRHKPDQPDVVNLDNLAPETVPGTDGPDPPDPPSGGLAAADDGEDDLQHAIDHGWNRHAPDGGDRLGTRHPAGTTRQQADEIFRDIAAREWVEAPAGPVDGALRARLDAGEVTLVERRSDHTNLYGRSGDVRYEIRLGGKNGTAHPIDGQGVVRKVRHGVGIVERELPIGSRPVEGWDRPRRLR